MDKEVLKRRMTERFQQRLEEATRAVEQAPDGQAIAASEWQVREVFQKLMAETFADLAQDRIEQHPAASRRLFPPVGRERAVLRNKGKRRLRVLTAGGELASSRRYFRARGEGGEFPADAVLGVGERAVPAGALGVLCRMGMVQDFEQARDDAKRIGGLPVCMGRLRQLVEAEAQAVTKARQAGAVPAAWPAAGAEVAAAGPVYAGVDGVMAPAVTQAEKGAG